MANFWNIGANLKMKLQNSQHQIIKLQIYAINIIGKQVTGFRGQASPATVTDFGDKSDLQLYGSRGRAKFPATFHSIPHFISFRHRMPSLTSAFDRSHCCHHVKLST